MREPTARSNRDETGVAGRVANRPPQGLPEADPLGHQTLRQEVRSVGRHSLIYMLGPAFSQLVGFLLIPIYTRLIAPSEYGVMSLVDVFLTLTMMVLGMGLADGMTRFYYERIDAHERRRLVSTVVFGAAGLSLPFVLLVIGLAQPLVDLLGIGPEFLAYLRIGLLTAWFSMMAEIGYAYLRMHYLAKAFVVLTVLQILVAVGLNLYFVVVCRLGIWGIIYSTLITQALLGSSLALLMILQSRVRPAAEYLKPLLGFGLPLVPSTVTLQLSNYLSPLLVRWLLAGDPLLILGQVGIFAMGQKVGVIVNRFVTVPFHAFWRPRRMELVLADNLQVRHILARMCTYSTLVTAQIALLLSVAAESLLRLLLDPRYWPAHQIVPLIAAGYVVLSLEHHFATGMHFARKTVAATWIGLVSLLVLVLADVLWIPRAGIWAAAAATLLSVSVRSTLFLVVSQRLYAIPFELRRLLMIGWVSVLLFLVSRGLAVESTWVTLLLRLACGLLLLPLLSWWKFFTHEEWNFLCRRLPNWIPHTGRVPRGSAVDLEQ